LRIPADVDVSPGQLGAVFTDMFEKVMVAPAFDFVSLFLYNKRRQPPVELLIFT